MFEVFEREAREFQSHHFLFLARDYDFNHKTLLLNLCLEKSLKYQRSNTGTDCTFLRDTSVNRVWSFKARVGQSITDVNELQNFRGDNSMSVPMCITFKEYSLFIENVADEFCLQSGGGMNAYVSFSFTPTSSSNKPHNT